MHKSGKGKLIGRGLQVYEDRWNSEGGLLHRLFPRLSARVGYMVKGFALGTKHREHIRRFQAMPVPPLFTQVELETQNRCNGTCAFCGVNRNAPQRPYARMDEAMFSSILDQLAGLDYKGALSLHSNNEPLLDKRLPDFAAEARKRLPQARLKMFTNGTLLTLDLFRRIMPDFDRLFINNYAESGRMLPNVREIHDFCQTPEGKALLAGKTLVIQLRDPGVILSSRGGSSPNREAPARAIRALCYYPYRQFIIRPDGGVSLCCNDALGQVTLGDLKAQSMLEVWRGTKATALRAAFAKKGRAGIPLCARCDFVK